MKDNKETGRHRDVEEPGAESGISARCRNGELKVELQGTFDAASADRLIECLERHRNHIKKAEIRTGRLTRVDSTGKSIFRERLHELKDLCYYLVFYGKHADEMSPTWTFSF